jgi:prevent-host-death family protein
MAGQERQATMKKASLAQVKDHLSQYLHDAEQEQVVITRHGKPAGVLIGFETEEDWFEYRLANDPVFLKRVEKARAKIKDGKGVSWEKIKKEDKK